MYHEHYGLVRSPFEMTPDPAFLYLGDAHREGLATLVYGVRARKGFTLLTGEVGTGKTTLLHALLAQLDRDTLSAFIFNPRLTPLDFFRMMFDELGIEKECRGKAEYLLALNHFLIERLEQNLSTLLIVDEAQNLSAEMLEEIRLLSNLETPSSKLIQIMLVGQPELWEMLSRPELRQLRQRIVLRHQLRPFDEKECEDYVQERLRLAGYTGTGLFNRAALKQLYRVTGGTPRLINIVCDGALLLGFGRDLQQIGRDAIREVAADLDLQPLTRSESKKVESTQATSTKRSGLLGWLRARQTGGSVMGKVYDALRKAEEARALRVEEVASGPAPILPEMPRETLGAPGPAPVPPRAPMPPMEAPATARPGFLGPALRSQEEEGRARLVDGVQQEADRPFAAGVLRGGAVSDASRPDRLDRRDEPHPHTGLHQRSLRRGEDHGLPILGGRILHERGAPGPADGL